MDLTLIPICNEQDHIVDNNKYRDREFNCSICNREGIYHQCINCDYSRCETCHMRSLRKIRDKQYERAIKISIHESLRKSLLREQSKLNKDGLREWSVKISRKDKELYYYNNYTRSISFDYPKIFKIPDRSPVLSESEIRLSEPVLSEPLSSAVVLSEPLSISGRAFKVFQDMKDKMKI